MYQLILALGGLFGGLILGIWVFRLLLRMPTTRIFLADWTNWNQVEMPTHYKQVIRHGKWVADEFEERP